MSSENRVRSDRDALVKGAARKSAERNTMFSQVVRAAIVAGLGCLSLALLSFFSPTLLKLAASFFSAVLFSVTTSVARSAFQELNPKARLNRIDGHWLQALTDWIPSRALRKKQRKLIADDRADIAEARFHGRHWLARWRLMWMYINWLRYLVFEPFVAAAGLVRKISAG